MYCCVVPKWSRDRVSGDVSFRRPAVELHVATMRSRAQACHRKSARRRPIRSRCGLKFFQGVLDASAHGVLGGSAVVINLTRSHGVFPVPVETSTRSDLFLSFFFSGTSKSLVRIGDENVVSNFQRLILRITGRRCFPLFQNALS